MTAARIDSAGTVRQLDGRAEPDEVVTVEDVADPAKVARLLGKLLADVAAGHRRFAPTRVDFEDVAVSSSGADVSLQHNLGGRVRWYLVGSTVNVTSLYEATSTTDDTLVLNVTSASNGYASFRVEAAT
jgi:hypothetical protein